MRVASVAAATRSPGGAADPVGLAVSVPNASESGVPEMARAAALDLVSSYRSQLVPGFDLDELRTRFEAGLLEVRSRSHLEADLAGQAIDADADFALLFRLRVLEDIAVRISRYEDGLAVAVTADSLAAALAARPEARSSLLPAVAGVHGPRLETERWRADLVASWERRFERDSSAGVTSFLTYHALVASGEAFPEIGDRRPADAWEATLAELAHALELGHVMAFSADDPARRLHLARCALEGARATESWRFDTPQEYGTRIARLDSLLAAWHETAQEHRVGSSLNYYRRESAAGAPQSASHAAAREVVTASVRDLRARLGGTLCSRLGMRIDVDLEPFEIVPGQSVRARWSVDSPSPRAIRDLRAYIADREVLLVEPPDTLGAGTSIQTSALQSPPADVGTRLLPELRLHFVLQDWGVVEILGRCPLQVVTPLQASLVAVGGPRIESSRKALDIVVTSRSPNLLEAMLRVLPTSGWDVEPARAFRIQLRRPGSSVQQRIEIVLPASASPGVYDFAARLDIDAEPVGTLRTQLVKPVRWIAAGPFDKPRSEASLEPEQGVDLQARFAGAGGLERTWHAVPWSAYDDGGGVNLHELYPAARENQCAVLFTMFESSEAGSANLRLSGDPMRVRWNGKEPGPGGEIRIELGRNTLLVRARLRAGEPLHAAWVDEHGETWRVLDNDLARLLNGFEELDAGGERAAATEPGERLVTLRFRARTAHEVSVLGAFSSWVPLPLERRPDGTWQRALRLAPGRYAYKLLVDGHMQPDPEARGSEPDGFGGRNSLLVVP